MSKKCIVTDISDKASEKTVKDFFLFCGKIKEFELIKEESSDKQIAYVTFEKDTAAKTALMLTNAVICDSQITVKSADDAGCGDDSTDDLNASGQEKKPKTLIFAEILASGYTLQETILQKGIEFDAKFGLTCVLNQYMAQLQENLQNINQKFHVYETVSTRATDLNQKYSVYENAKYIYEQAQDKASHLLETTTGKMILEYLLITQKQVSDVQALAKRIANENKKDKNFNPTPSHSHSEVQDSNQPISTQ